MPKPFGTPGAVGYVDPFAATKPDPAPAQVQPLKDSYNTIVTGINNAKKPASEPAVISSQGAQDTANEAKSKLADMSNKGTMIDPTTGNTHYADGSMAAPAGATYDEATGQYKASDSKDYSVASFYDENNPDPNVAAIQKLFAPLKASLDSDTLGQVNAIQQQFDSYRSMAEEVNRMAEQSRSHALSLGGATRYAPDTASGLNMNQAYLGLSKIQDLDAQENMAIAKAKSAQTQGDLKNMTDMLTMAEGVRKQKQDHATSVMDAIGKANEALQTKRAEISRDESVAKLMSAGTTDPAEILNELKAAGMDVSSGDVAAAVKNLTPAKTTTGQYKFTNADVGKMLASGMTAPVIQKVQDYYNGTGTSPELTAEQSAAVHNVLTSTTPKSAKAAVQSKPILDGTLSYTPEDHAQDSQKLEASRGQDGFVDPTIYQNLYTAWIGHGGSLEGFIKTYPPKNYVNPDNEWLPSYLKPKKAAAAGGITAADIDALFSSPK